MDGCVQFITKQDPTFLALEFEYTEIGWKYGPSHANWPEVNFNKDVAVILMLVNFSGHWTLFVSTAFA